VSSPATTTPSTPPRAAGDLREQVQSLRLPPAHETRRSATGVLAWVVCGVLLLTNAATGYLWWTQRVAKSTANPAAQPAVSEGNRAAPGGAAGNGAAAAPGEIALESKGYIQPTHQILVSPKVAGMVLKLDIEEGMRVEKGQELAVIETTEYQAEHDRAKATMELMHQRVLELERGNRPEEIARADAELAEAQETLTELERDYRRINGLREQNASSEQALTQSQSLFLAQQQRVSALTSALALMKEGPRVERIEQARAEFRQSEAEYARAAWRLDNCTIRAPISGTILTKNAEEGNIVNPVAFNGSFSLCDMADLSDLEVELDIQERDVSKVFKGQRCKVRAEAFPERTYDGIVSRLMPIADRAKGSVPVRVKLTVPKDEEGVYLKPEMGALVTFYKEAAPESAGAPTPSGATADGPVPAE
jgi:multidrug resistance efflux pump